MPNGGVPLHMLMRPKKGQDVVVYCKGAELCVIAKEEWGKSKHKAKPLLALTHEEALVLERFFRYWLQDKEEGPIYNRQA